MSSLSPPKFIKMLRNQDQHDLISALRALADEWEDPEGQTSFGAEIGKDYAKDLRKILDQHT